MRWYRWEAVIVGRESGNVTPLSFVRFRHERDAQRWVQRMNCGLHERGLTAFDYRRRG